MDDGKYTTRKPLSAEIRELADSIEEVGDWAMNELIRRAVMRERERCAQLVQKAADTWWVKFSPDAGDLRRLIQEILNG